MSTSLQVFRAQVDHLIAADSDLLAEDARDGQIEAALERYSGDAPNTFSEDVSGDGGRYYVLSSVLDNWTEGFSRVVQIEYPAATVASDETPVYLEPEDFQDDFYAEISGTHTRHLYLPNHAPAATDTMRITYTAPYTFDDATRATDTPTQDFFAICNLAAGLCCQALAARFAKSSDSTINADVVDGRTTSAEFAARAREFIALYEKHMGLGVEQKQRAAGDFVDWDTAPAWPSGRRYAFHGKGTR